VLVATNTLPFVTR